MILFSVLAAVGACVVLTLLDAFYDRQMGKAYNPLNGFFLFHGNGILVRRLFFFSADHAIEVF